MQHQAVHELHPEWNPEMFAGNHQDHRIKIILILTLLMFRAIHPTWADSSEPGLGIFRENARCFAWNGKPIFLASKSFGWTALSEPGFDHVRDIRTAAACGGNLLRLTLFWPGHGEEGGELPSRRDAATGQYNLDEFNPAYFARLRDYLAVAGDHEMVVNLELFDHPAVKGGVSRWPVHRMNRTGLCMSFARDAAHRLEAGMLDGTGSELQETQGPRNALSVTRRGEPHAALVQHRAAGEVGNS